MHLTSNPVLLFIGKTNQIKDKEDKGYDMNDGTIGPVSDVL